MDGMKLYVLSPISSKKFQVRDVIDVSSQTPGMIRTMRAILEKEFKLVTWLTIEDVHDRAKKLGVEVTFA